MAAPVDVAQNFKKCRFVSSWIQFSKSGAVVEAGSGGYVQCNGRAEKFTPSIRVRH